MTHKLKPFTVAIHATEKALATVKTKLEQTKADFEIYIDFRRRDELLCKLAFEIGCLGGQVKMSTPAQRKKVDTDLKAKRCEYNQTAKFNPLKQRDHRCLSA